MTPRTRRRGRAERSAPAYRSAAWVCAISLILGGCAATAAAPGSGNDGPRTGSTRGASAPVGLFTAGSPWNTTADTRSVHPASQRLLRLAAEPAGPSSAAITAASRAGLELITRGWTSPILDSGEPTEVRCRTTTCGDGAGPLTLEVPGDVDPDPLHDGWLILHDVEHRILYDLWRARREDDGSLSYAFLRAWDAGGPGFSRPYVEGVRGSGLPLAAGVVRRHELELGQIDHALALSVPGAAAGSFLQPASDTDGRGEPGSLPEGARVFLRADAVYARPLDPQTGRPLPMTQQQYRSAHALVEALRTYGAIVVGTSRTPSLAVEPATSAAEARVLAGYELTGLHLADFAVVAFSAVDRFALSSGVGQ